MSENNHISKFFKLNASKQNWNISDFKAMGYSAETKDEHGLYFVDYIFEFQNKQLLHNAFKEGFFSCKNEQFYYGSTPAEENKYAEIIFNLISFSMGNDDDVPLCKLSAEEFENMIERLYEKQKYVLNYCKNFERKYEDRFGYTAA